MKKVFAGIILAAICIPTSLYAFTWWKPSTWFSSDAASTSPEISMAAVVEAIKDGDVSKDDLQVTLDIGYLQSQVSELRAKNDSLLSDLNQMKVNFESLKKTLQPDKRCAEAKNQYKLQTDKLFDLKLKRDKDVLNVRTSNMTTELGIQSAANALRDYYENIIIPVDIEVSRALRDMDLYCP